MLCTYKIAKGLKTNILNLAQSDSMPSQAVLENAGLFIVQLIVLHKRKRACHPFIIIKTLICVNNMDKYISLYITFMPTL